MKGKGLYKVSYGDFDMPIFTCVAVSTSKAILEGLKNDLMNNRSYAEIEGEVKYIIKDERIEIII